jgi:hypothetical protein
VFILKEGVGSQVVFIDISIYLLEVEIEEGEHQGREGYKV